MTSANPVSSNERFIILDVLRGLALFGICFSIILSNVQRKKANGFHIFYRRMFVLALIGFLHLMFIWSGDILLLYADSYGGVFRFLIQGALVRLRSL